MSPNWENSDVRPDLAYYLVDRSCLLHLFGSAVMRIFRAMNHGVWFSLKGRPGQARLLNLFERMAYRRKYPNGTATHTTGVVSRQHFGWW
jgi:hypothetical protein